MAPDEIVQDEVVVDAPEVEAEPEVVVETAEPEVAAPPDPTEALARADGWRSKEEFEASGMDPNRWVPADKYLARRSDKIKQLERTIHETKQSAVQFKEFVKRQQAAEVTALRGEIARLKQVREDALFEQDRDTYRAAEDAIGKTQARLEQTMKTPSEPPPPDPVFVEWSKANVWYDKDADPETWEEATAYGKALVDMGTPYDKMLEKVAKRFAPQTSKPPPSAPPVEGARPSGANGNRIPQFRDLPADAQRQFREFQRLGAYKNTGDINKDSEEYRRELKQMGAF